MSAFSRDGDRIRLDMSVDQFEQLLFALGLAAGAADPPLRKNLIRLANEINEGNPDFDQYNLVDW